MKIRHMQVADNAYFNTKIMLWMKCIWRAFYSILNIHVAFYKKYASALKIIGEGWMDNERAKPENWLQSRFVKTM